MNYATLSLLLAASLLLPAIHAQEQGLDTVITADTTWRDATHTVARDLIVKAPATLRLEGVRLLVGDHVFVERGARLELHPSATTATEVSPLVPTVTDSWNGLWMAINGTLVTSGLPRTEIHGLRGSGLTGVYNRGPIVGGIQVSGVADLRDLFLHDGNGTVFVSIAGAVRLRDSTLSNLGEIGVGVRGLLQAENLTLTGSRSGIVGFVSCAMRLHNVTITAPREGILANSCPLEVTDSTLLGGLHGIYQSGNAKLTLLRTRITGYAAHGINAQGTPDVPHGTKTTLHPELRVEDSTFRAKPGTNTSVGIWMSGGIATVSRSVIEGNGGDGIHGEEGGGLNVTATTVHANGGFGIFTRALRIGGNLLEGNDLGTPGTASANAKGQVQSVVPIVVGVRNQYNRTLPSNTTVLDIHQANVFKRNFQASGFTVGSVDAYRQMPDGRSEFQGPFIYTVTQKDLGSRTGTLDLSSPGIFIFVETAPPAAPAGAGGLDAPAWAALGTGAVALAACALAWKPVMRRFGPAPDALATSPPTSAEPPEAPRSEGAEARDGEQPA